MLVLLVGVIQLLAGLFRLGFLVRFVSNAVMTGFLNGVAVLIILGQLADLTGYRSTFSNPVGRALDLLLRINQVDLRVSAIGAFTLGLIVLMLWVKSLQRFAFIIAIAVATVLLAVLTIPALSSAPNFAVVPTVGDIASIPRSLPQFAIPQLSLFLSLLLPAFSVAIIGLVQGAGVSQGTPNPDGRYPDVSRDFLGQGAANIATSLAGGIPAGGSVSGTALIMSAGGKSRWGNIFVGLFVAAIVLLAAPLVELVPMPALAALLIVAGFQGLRVPQAVIAWKTGRISRAVMLVTFVATLVVPAAVRGPVRHGAEHRAARLSPIEQGRRHPMGAATGRVSAGAAAAGTVAQPPAHPVARLWQPVLCRGQEHGRAAAASGQRHARRGRDQPARQERDREHVHDRVAALQRGAAGQHRAS